ncbi:MAG TPA: CYCXC family (seleno)protein [Pyrinomonadaceae bacterium]
MKNRLLFALIALLALGAGFLLFMYSPSSSQRVTDSQANASHDQSSHSAQHQTAQVPAFQKASEIGDLPPTLPAANFVGKTREAYMAAKEIPETLAQLPCYCYCDKAFGHKSLHTCFTDDHASQCAVCVDEALLAYRLQKEEKKTPEQVRQIIIEKYAATTN